MKVTADPDAREVSAVCARLVPRAFSTHEGEDGEHVLVIADGGEFLPELAGGIRDAVSRCSKMALSLQDLCSTSKNKSPQQRISRTGAADCGRATMIRAYPAY